MKIDAMHIDEISIERARVQDLVYKQFPQWSDLPIMAITSQGTDNTTFRFGSCLAIRLPRTPSAALNIDKEYHWLPILAKQLSFAIPIPLVKGVPNDVYPYSWYIYHWLKGQNTKPSDLTVVAKQLGVFLKEMHAIGTQNAPISQRGVPLSTRNEETMDSLAELSDIVDCQAALKIWHGALEAPAWENAPVWIHGDVHPGNLLFSEEQLVGVLDFGLAGLGDPACDVMAAWTLFTDQSRALFRKALSVDDATWMRARGWALSFGLSAYAYYKNRNTTLASIALYTIKEVMSERT